MHSHHTPVLDIYFTMGSAIKMVLHQLIGAFRNFYPSNFRHGLPTGGKIDGIAPNIIDKLFGARYPTHNRSGIDCCRI